MRAIRTNEINSLPATFARTGLNPINSLITPSQNLRWPLNFTNRLVPFPRQFFAVHRSPSLLCLGPSAFPPDSLFILFSLLRLFPHSYLPTPRLAIPFLHSLPLSMATIQQPSGLLDGFQYARSLDHCGTLCALVSFPRYLGDVALRRGGSTKLNKFSRKYLGKTFRRPDISDYAMIIKPRSVECTSKTKIIRRMFLYSSIWIFELLNYLVDIIWTKKILSGRIFIFIDNDY